MPVFRLQSNALLDAQQRASLRKDLSASIASWLGKSESYVLVHLELDLDMIFGGTDDPCAYCELASLGLDSSNHPSLAASVTSLVSERLSVAPDRIYIRFEAPARTDFAWDGKPFA